MLGGFTKITWLAQLAKRKYYKLAVHHCQGRQANPPVILTLSAEAQRSLKRSVAEGPADRSGITRLLSDSWGCSSDHGSPQLTCCSRPV